jgi:hypothetical protein
MRDFRKLLDDLETAAWRAMLAAKRQEEPCAATLVQTFLTIEQLVNEYEEETK